MDNSNSYYPPTYFPGHMQPPSQTPSGPSHLSGSHSNSHPHPHPHAQTHAQSYASYPGSAEQSRQSTAAPSPSSSGSSQSPSASASASHAYPQAEAQGSGSGSQSHGPLVEPHQDLNDFLESFWTRQVDNVEREEPDFKNYPLPLARIKKVMKSDEDVKMISAEGKWAPIMFSRACEIFISELTCRAWLVAESHKRRTLQKSDVAAAIAFSDMFDFLIDIIPRDDGEVGEESKPSGVEDGDGDGAPAAGDAEGGGEGEGEGEGEGDEQGEGEDQDQGDGQGEGEGYGGRLEGEGYGAALRGEAINGAREVGYRDTGADEFERFVHG